MISVHCRLVGELRRYLPGGEGVVEAPVSSTVGDLLERLQVPEPQTLVVGVNGEKVAHSELLTDGDEITIVAAMTGGVG